MNNSEQKSAIPQPQNLGQLLELRVAKTPEKDFLFSEVDGRKFTYAEFAACANTTAHLLRGHGVGKGDVVSLLMANSAEYIIAYYACWKLGALAARKFFLKAEGYLRDGNSAA